MELLKRLLCKKELDELTRWRNLSQHYERWLAEFKDISFLLECIREEANGSKAFAVSDVRDAIRAERSTFPDDFLKEKIAEKVLMFRGHDTHMDETAEHRCATAIMVILKRRGVS